MGARRRRAAIGAALVAAGALGWFFLLRPHLTRSANVAKATRMYDATEIGMPVKDAANVAAFEPMEGRKYIWAKDFGRSFTRECVEVRVYLHDGQVVRVDMAHPYDTARKGDILKEKGMSLPAWERRPVAPERP